MTSSIEIIEHIVDLAQTEAVLQRTSNDNLGKLLEDHLNRLNPNDPTVVDSYTTVTEILNKY